jgi:capsular exopolysaccharide synthesis family protein
LELQDYVRAIRKYWLLVTICAAMGVAAAAVVTIRTTPTYASRATLYISATTVGSNADAYQGGLFSQQSAKTYALLVKGELITQAVIREEGLSMSPAALAGKISARVIPDTTLLEITVTDTKPAQAQRLATAVAEELSTQVTSLVQPTADQPASIRMTTISSPTLPSTPFAPQPGRTLPLGLLCGLIAGMVFAFLREVLDTSVKTPDLLNDKTGAPSLGVIAHDGDANTHPLVVQLEPRSPRAEAFRQLRTNLQFVNVDRRPKRIVVTSSVPSEGKTTTTANLALTLAEAGQRVVLIEGDVRRPRLGTYLGLESASGLTSVLIGRADPEDAIQQWGDLPLEVLASGPIPPNPSELLQSRAMELLLQELDRRADIILIDAPPLLPVTDAALLARMSDGAVLVVRHGKTTVDQVQKACDNLEKVGARLLGTVLNMAPAKGPDAQTYGYGYGYAPEAGRRRAPVNTPA